MKNQNQNYHKNKVTDSEVAWNASNLFYILLNQFDMDYSEAYYYNDYNKMEKAFELKFLKVKIFIEKYAKPEEMEFLKDERSIRLLADKFKKDDSDYSTKHNMNIANQIMDITKQKMALLEELMSKAGMNLFLEKIREIRPAALSTDDF